MKPIEKLWAAISLEPAAAGTFRLFEGHSLDLWAGLDLDGRRVLMLVTDVAPGELPPPGVIEVSLTERGDKRFSLIFRLARPEFHELFGRLCQDLVEATQTSERRGGAERLLARLARWRRLLEPSPDQCLTDAQLRGLFGELWFLKTVAIPCFGHLHAVNSWNGPMGAPQDFQLGPGLVEVKTILPGGHRVSISSAEQLENGETSLQLAVIVIDASKGISPVELVAQIRGELELASGTASEFELRLAEVGYTDRQEYEQLQFTVQTIRYYPVTASFPRIVTSKLPAGLSRITYDLDLLECGVPRSEYIYAAG
jgi:hypothetical protein